MHDDRNLPIPSGGTPGSSPFDRIMLLDEHGRERWAARDLQQLMGYDRWERFAEVVERAIETIDAADIDGRDHIRGAARVMGTGRWGRTRVKDYRLTRFGAYQVALAGDGRKPDVAAAKTYFAVKTREAELAVPAVPDTPEGHLALAQNYLAAAKELLTARKELAVAKPKAGKWDALCDSEGLIDMGAAAKAFHDVTGGLGRTKFMDVLRSDEVRFLQVQNPRVPYHEHVQTGP